SQLPWLPRRLLSRSSPPRLCFGLCSTSGASLTTLAGRMVQETCDCLHASHCHGRYLFRPPRRTGRLSQFTRHLLAFMIAGAIVVVCTGNRRSDPAVAATRAFPHFLWGPPARVLWAGVAGERFGMATLQPARRLKN